MSYVSSTHRPGKWLGPNELIIFTKHITPPKAPDCNAVIHITPRHPRHWCSKLYSAGWLSVCLVNYLCLVNCLSVCLVIYLSICVCLSAIFLSLVSLPSALHHPHPFPPLPPVYAFNPTFQSYGISGLINPPLVVGFPLPGLLAR